MAYKFQLGSAKLGGSIEAGAISGSALSSSAVEADTADKVIAAVANGDIPIAKLAEKSITVAGKAADLGGSITLDGLSAANGISMSSFNGSAAVSDLTIQRSGSAHALKLTSDGIAVLLSGSTGLSIDDGGLKLSAVPNASLANDEVSFGGVTVALGASNATPAFDLSTATDYRTSALDGTITNAQLAGSIVNSKLVNDSVSYGGVVLALGGVNATPAFNLSTATAYVGDSSLVTVGALNAGSITSGFTSIDVGTGAISGGDITGVTGSFSGDLTVTGDLQVNGDLTYVNTVDLKVKDALVTFASGTSAFGAGRGFEIGEGSAAEGNFKTAAAAGDLPNHFASSLALSSSAYYGDGSNLQGVSATGVQMVSAKLDSAFAATGSITNERYVIADSANRAMLINLPSIAPAAKGTMIIIKRVGGNNVTISSANTSQVVEGINQDITLETDGAAVTLMATDEGDVTHGGWRIV
jgi:hypothetical protein